MFLLLVKAKSERHELDPFCFSDKKLDAAFVDGTAVVDRSWKSSKKRMFSMAVGSGVSVMAEDEVSRK